MHLVRSGSAARVGRDDRFAAERGHLTPTWTAQPPATPFVGPGRQTRSGPHAAKLQSGRDLRTPTGGFVA